MKTVSLPIENIKAFKKSCEALEGLNFISYDENSKMAEISYMKGFNLFFLGVHYNCQDQLMKIKTK
jgi:hypothetical protein